MYPVINTREDMEQFCGTMTYDQLKAYLKGTMVRRVNTTVYPENYDYTLRPGDPGYIQPQWEEIEDLSTIEAFGFTKADLEG